MVKKLMFGNFKGGVGKSSNSTLFSYHLAQRGYKTLLIDLDPQKNSTDSMLRTYAVQNDEELEIEKSMMVAIQEGDLSQSVVEIMENLYIIPSDYDFTDYPDFLEFVYPATTENYKESRVAHFTELLRPIEDDFDFIIFDVPPTLNDYAKTGLYDADLVIIVLQTQQKSLDGAMAFWNYLQKFYNQFTNTHFDILGVLGVLQKNDAAIDNSIINDAIEIFGEEMLFSKIVPQMDRLKRYDRQGITEKGYTKWNDYHDTVVHNFYNSLTDELLERIKEREE
ncbi:ParA family protein [Enterococcus sp. DIV0800]|uniref:ParA family protein n=1 Tax=unclassified Enterococcus TaxID=2608891 RepID=UPI003D2FFF10